MKREPSFALVLKLVKYCVVMGIRIFYQDYMYADDTRRYANMYLFEKGG